MGEPAVEVRGLRKSFGSTEAVAGIATGTTDAVRSGKALQRAFIDLIGPRACDEEEVLSWFGSSSS